MDSKTCASNETIEVNPTKKFPVYDKSDVAFIPKKHMKIFDLDILCVDCADVYFPEAKFSEEFETALCLTSLGVNVCFRKRMFIGKEIRRSCDYICSITLLSPKKNIKLKYSNITLHEWKGMNTVLTFPPLPVCCMFYYFELYCEDEDGKEISIQEEADVEHLLLKNGKEYEPEYFLKQVGNYTESCFTLSFGDDSKYKIARGLLYQ
jgi:hypothetical protein